VVLRGGEQNSNYPEKDYALLRLNEPFADDSAADMNWLGEPLPNARLLVVQVNMYKLIATRTSFESNLDKLLTTEDNPSCRLFGDATHSFLLNGCQSESGTSGAPYIQKGAAGNLRLVGVHAGPTARLKTVELSDCSISLPNYGVRLPIPEMLKFMGGAN
jgi:hypothetical protein